ncbi:hypothetical protein [Petroclostridium sp. X23]|uniref:ornithine cyclodeaminase family domain n=1 Tax=Petroclostridium sp. X23 TaxID=3045146 RepID=UPI0024AE806F|nr:hypothetical protein [Petroclostridium sp. X23]WHH57964.1 hypothetical protein QKW49_19455 [Petroclostridium sp. X23]
MNFILPEYNAPDFESDTFISSPNVHTEVVVKDGVAPDNFHATTIFPEYFKINDKWTLVDKSRMDCVVAIKDDGSLEVKEFRKLKMGERVVVGRAEDATQGIYVHTDGFRGNQQSSDETFVFRTGRSRETSFSRDYDRLYELLTYEKDHGHIVFVLGPAVTFDHDSKKAMISLIEKGYVSTILAGNALATHDLEGALFKTALGQDIYTQVPISKGHYHHIDVINKARQYSSLDEFIKQEHVCDGIVYACIKNNIPLILAGSIRDDGPLPGIISNVYDAQDLMREYTKKATTVLGLATQLHTIAVGNMTPSYQVINNRIRPVFIYSVDISEFVVNKLRDRGTLEVTSIVTNVQDFLVNLDRNLL